MLIDLGAVFPVEDLIVSSGEIDLNGNTMTVNSTITLEVPGPFSVNTGTYTPLYGTGSFIDNGGTFNP